MRIRFAVAALTAVLVSAPTLASAETTVIKRFGDGDHFRGARSEMRFDRGFHRGWSHRHADRVVIIKHGRHRHWD